jgi:ribosomal protein L40E
MPEKGQKNEEDKEFFKQKTCLRCGVILQDKKDWNELNPNICLECFEKAKEEEIEAWKKQTQEEEEGDW